MLPARCMNPPCRNIDVKTVAHVGTGEATSTSRGPLAVATRTLSMTSPLVSSPGIRPKR